MPYVQQTDIAAEIPPAFVTQALDDNEDGVADEGVWDAVAAAAGTDIEGRLGQRYAVPFQAPYPAVVVQAARIFASEKLYLRRGFAGDKNPFTEQADAMRKKLDRIGEGEEPLTPQLQREQPSASAITERAKAFSCSGAIPI